jgi:hypothetical protein
MELLTDKVPVLGTTTDGFHFENLTINLSTKEGVYSVSDAHQKHIGTLHASFVAGKFIYELMYDKPVSKTTHEFQRKLNVLVYDVRADLEDQLK